MRTVILNTYDTYFEAHVVKNLLETEGISAFLHDENTVTIDPMLTNAIGGIKLLVHENDETAAKAILKEQKDENKKNLICPKCGSDNVEYIVAQKPSNWMLALLSYFFMSYPLAGDKTYHCFDCKCNFEANSSLSQQD